MNRLRRMITGRVKTLSSLDAYALWASAYPPYAHNPFMEFEQRAMLAMLPPLQGAVVLDLACGTGRYGLLAQEREARQVIAIDNSAAMLEANPLALRIQATGTALPLRSASIDVILCGLALGHLPDLTEAVGEIARVLRPLGVALISDVHPFVALNGGQRTFSSSDGRQYAVEHYAHLYEDYTRAAFQAGLRIDAISEPRIGGSPVLIVYRMVKLT